MSRLLARTVVLVGLFLLLCPGQILGQGLDNGSLARLFVRAQVKTGIPSGLLAAIAIQESSFHPWSVNLAGRGYHPGSWRSALVRVRKSDARSYDIGLMQINSAWLDRFNISQRQVLNPAMNVTLGSLILRDCLKRHGLVGGIGCYHTGDPDSRRGRRYARKVLRNWNILDDSGP